MQMQHFFIPANSATKHRLVTDWFNVLSKYTSFCSTENQTLDFGLAVDHSTTILRSHSWAVKMYHHIISKSSSKLNIFGQSPTKCRWVTCTHDFPFTHRASCIRQSWNYCKLPQLFATFQMSNGVYGFAKVHIILNLLPFFCWNHSNTAIKLNY